MPDEQTPEPQDFSDVAAAIAQRVSQHLKHELLRLPEMKDEDLQAIALSAITLISAMALERLLRRYSPAGRAEMFQTYCQQVVDTIIKLERHYARGEGRQN